MKREEIKDAKIHVFADIKDQLNALADFFVQKADEAIAERKRFSVALSGGHSPKKLYELLATEPYRKKVNWPDVYFFFGDERYVPAQDSRSNALMAKEALLDPLGIPGKNIFTINTSLPPPEAATAYWLSVQEHFKQEPVQFDLILLGLGDNAHTASLFPGTEVLKERTASVKAVFVPALNAYRITFTAPLINQAHHVAFLVFGESKATAVSHVIKAPANPEKYPAQLIQPYPGTLDWFLDAAAASRLKQTNPEGLAN